MRALIQRVYSTTIYFELSYLGAIAMSSFPKNTHIQHQHILEDFFNDFAQKALSLSKSLRASPPVPLPLLKSAFVKSDTFQIEEVKESDRIFEGWGSIEMVDRDGDFIPIDAISQVMETYMKRGGVITDSHSSRIVGKMLDWNVKSREDGKKGIWLKGSIHDDYPIDDAVWHAIKTGHYEGFSLGGDAFEKYMECDEAECYQKIPKMALYEWSVVRIPSNQGAIIQAVNAMAKEHKRVDHKKEFTNKAHLFLQYATKHGLDNLNAHEVLSKCGICKNYVDDLLLNGLSKDEALMLLQHELDTILHKQVNKKKEETKTMSEITNKEGEEMIDKQNPPPTAQPPQMPGQPNDLGAKIDQLIKMVAAMMQAQGAAPAPVAPQPPMPKTLKTDNPKSIKEPEEDEKEPEKGEDKKEILDKETPPTPEIVIPPELLQEKLDELLQKEYGLKKVYTPKPGIDVVHPSDIKDEANKDTTAMELYKAASTGKIFDDPIVPGDRLSNAFAKTNMARVKEEGRM